MFDAHYIIVAGPIGVGKSTLTKYLAENHYFQPLYEEPDRNPFLPQFYAGKEQDVAFELQLHFLGQRIQQCHEARQYLRAGFKVVQDRSIYEDLDIFTTHHYHTGMIKALQFQTYCQLYDGVVPCLPNPDLIIYLSAPIATLRDRIVHRGRPYEQQIDLQYLHELNQLYKTWAAKMQARSDLAFIHIDTTALDLSSPLGHQFINRLLLEYHPASA